MLTKRRRDVKLDAGGVLSAVVRLQGRGGPCVQYGEGQLQQDKDYGEEELVQLGFEGKHGLHEGTHEDQARDGCVEVRSSPSQVQSPDQELAQAQLHQQCLQQYPGDASHSLAQSGDMEFILNTIKRSRLPWDTFLQPTEENEEEVHAGEDSDDTVGGIETTLSTSLVQGVMKEEKMHVSNVLSPTQLVHEDAELQPGLVHVGSEPHHLPATDHRYLLHDRRVGEDDHRVRPGGELEGLPPDGHDHPHQDAIPAQVVPRNVQQPVAVIRRGDNSDEEVQGIFSKVLAIPLKLTEFLVHRGFFQQIFITVIALIHGLQSLRDDVGDNLLPGADLHHQGGGKAGQDQAHLLPGHTRGGILDFNTSFQASQFPYLKIINILVNYTEDGANLALLTYIGGEMVAVLALIALSVSMCTIYTHPWIMDKDILNTSFSTCMRSCMGSNHGIALDGSFQTLKVVLGICVVESLSGFSGSAIKTNMEDGIDRGLDDRVQSVRNQPQHECAVQVQSLHEHPRPDQGETYVVENTEEKMETVGADAVSSSLRSIQVEAGGPGHFVLEEQPGKHLQGLQRVLTHAHSNHKEELLHCHGFQSQHLLLQDVREGRWDLQLAAAQEVVVQLDAGKEDLGELIGQPDDVMEEAVPWVDAVNRLSTEQGGQVPDISSLSKNSEKVNEDRNDHKDTAVYVPTRENERTRSDSNTRLERPFIIDSSTDKKEVEVLVRLASTVEGFQPVQSSPEKVIGSTSDNSDTALSPPYSSQRGDKTTSAAVEGNAITNSDVISSSTDKAKRDMLEERKTTHMVESTNNTHATRVPKLTIPSTGPVSPNQVSLLVPVHEHQQQVMRVHDRDLHSIHGGVHRIGQQHVEGCLCQDDQHKSHRRVRGPTQISSIINLKANNQYNCPEVGSLSPMQNVARAFILVRDRNHGSRVMVIPIKTLLASDMLRNVVCLFALWTCSRSQNVVDLTQASFVCKDDLK